MTKVDAQRKEVKMLEMLEDCDDADNICARDRMDLVAAVAVPEDIHRDAIIIVMLSN